MTQLIATVREHENRIFPSRKKNQPSKSQKRTVDSIEHGKKNLSWYKKNLQSIYHDGENPLIYIYISSDQKLWTTNHQPSINLSDYPPPHRSFGSDQKSVSTMLHSSLPFGTWNTKRWIATAVRSTVSHWTINPLFPQELVGKVINFWNDIKFVFNIQGLSHNFIEIFDMRILNPKQWM